MFDREKVIEILIDDDFDAILTGGDYGYLADILYGGHVGYNHMTDKMLMEECEERDISYLTGETE